MCGSASQVIGNNSIMVKKIFVVNRVSKNVSNESVRDNVDIEEALDLTGECYVSDLN